MYLIGDEMKEFLESSVAVIIGTADRDGRPHVTSGWGPRVGVSRATLTVFLEEGRAAATLADLRATHRIAATVADPVSYRSVQLKGRSMETGAPTEADEAWVRRHREGFRSVTALVGDPPGTVRWMESVTRVVFAIEKAFDQTPGAGAGREL